MGDNVTARADNEESGQVVGDEEDVAGEEDNVVEKIDEEVGDAVVKNGFFEVGIEGNEGWVWVVVYGGDCEEHGGCAVEERDEAA